MVYTDCVDTNVVFLTNLLENFELILGKLHVEGNILETKFITLAGNYC